MGARVCCVAGKNPQMGRIRRSTIATCHRVDAVKAHPENFPCTHSIRNDEPPELLDPFGTRGPVKKSRTLVRNSRHGDSQSTPKSSLGRRECAGNSSSSISCSAPLCVTVGIVLVIIPAKQNAAAELAGRELGAR